MKCINLLRLMYSIAAIGALLFGGNVQAATIGLTPVMVNGDRMVSDSVLNVTWADVVPMSGVAFYAGQGNSWGVTYTGSVQEWIATLNNQNYGGFNDWRLATDDGNGNLALSIGAFNPTECQSSSPDELGCLFYNQLGNAVNALSASVGYSVTNFGPFTSLQNNYILWSGTQRLTGVSTWVFSLVYSNQSENGQNPPDVEVYRTLAVRNGQTLDAPPPVTPIPATVWLLLSSIGGLGVFARKRKA